jgi:hypothetical protein
MLWARHRFRVLVALAAGKASAPPFHSQGTPFATAIFSCPEETWAGAASQRRLTHETSSRSFAKHWNVGCCDGPSPERACVATQHRIFRGSVGHIQRTGIQVYSGPHVAGWLGTAQCPGAVAVGRSGSRWFPYADSNTDTYSEPHSDAYSYPEANSYTYANTDPHSYTNQRWWRQLRRSMEFHYAVLCGLRG